MNGHDDILLPMIPGNEISGEVLEVGAKCRNGLKIGDHVAAIQREYHFHFIQIAAQSCNFPFVPKKI